MAQHDYIISNQTFPNTRQDINNLAEAVATNNSGTSAPTTQYAGQFWIDTTTTTWTLYIHDGTDDIQFATIDTSANTVNFVDSALDVVTDTTPQLGGNLDLNSNDITGTGNINITGTATVSGDLTVDTNTLKVDSTNNRVGIGTSSPSYKLHVSDTSLGALNPGVVARFGNNSTNFQIARRTDGDAIGPFENVALIFEKNNGSETMRIDSSGRVGIGTSSPSSFNSQARNLVVGTGSGANGITIYSGNASTADIFFADGTTGDDPTRGGINYSHSNNSMNFRVNDAPKMYILSSGNVGIGTSSPDSILHLYSNNSGGTPQSRSALIIEDTESNGDSIQFLSTDTGFQSIFFGDASDNDVGRIAYSHSDNSMRFNTNASEAMRIDSTGSVLVGKTSTDLSVGGSRLIYNGALQLCRTTDYGLLINRISNDGTLIEFYQGGSNEGSISVSGATVSYNGFTGTHWSRLADNSKPTILKGTILESLDEMMDWYQVQFDITDEEGNTITHKESYALADGQSVGDVITYTYEGTDYQATIIQEGDVKHTKSKISDTVDAKNVYGVFMDWDNDDDTVNDMYVAQTGTFVVRLNSSVTTLNKGDLIQSNGDGTGKVQADDIIRSSTVAKVLSTTKIETYDDGSYIVPCSLHC